MTAVCVIMSIPPPRARPTTPISRILPIPLQPSWQALNQKGVLLIVQACQSTMMCRAMSISCFHRQQFCHLRSARVRSAWRPLWHSGC